MDHLGEISAHAAQAFGDKTALVCEDKSFSFNEIDALSCQLANALQAKGVEPGDRVTIYSQNCWEWLVAYYGTAKTGAVLNPINVMLTPPEVGFVTNDCGARVIIAGADKVDALMDVKGNTPLEHVISFGDQAPAGATAFADLLRDGKTSFTPEQRAPNDLSTICYTSGTTGHPKGAMQSQKSVILNAQLLAIMHRRMAEDTVVSALPCPHVYGNVIMNGCFLYGMKLVMLPRFDETAVLDAIQEHKATMYEGVPTSYMMILTHPKLDDYDLSSITRMTVGGQTMPVAKQEDVQDRFKAPLLELWGMTELSGAGTTHAWYAENRLGSIGVSLPYINCKVSDADDVSKTMPTGEVGELMVKGPLVMQGYFGNEKATRENIEPDGWMHTGDLVSMDADGYVFVVDRRKDMINSSGFNVYPAEIERVLAAHPAIAMSAVGPQADELKGEIAKAYIVLKPGAETDADNVVAFCKERLAAYKVPRAVQFVEALPTTSTGKVMRRKLVTLDA